MITDQGPAFTPLALSVHNNARTEGGNYILLNSHVIVQIYTIQWVVLRRARGGIAREELACQGI
jgi:hypothetical protein